MQLDIEESSAQKPWQVAEFVFGKNLNMFPLPSLHFYFSFIWWFGKCISMVLLLEYMMKR